MSLQPGARFFIVATLFAVFYFIAGNIGSGWIYLLSSSMLVVLSVGTLLPLLLLLAVRWNRNCDATGTAGQVLDTWTHMSSPVDLWWLRVSSAEPQTDNVVAPHLVPHLKSQISIRLNIGPLKRGLQPLGAIQISTCFPLGIAWAKRTVDDNSTITVYPKVLPLDGYFLYKLPPSLSGSGGLARGSKSARQSTSTRGVREYIRGDSPRIVHWASSARTGRLLVREFEAEGLPQYDVLLDLASGWKSAEQFELAVTTAASLLALGYRLGIGPRLIIQPAAISSELELPALTPGLQADMEVLARIMPVAAIADSQSSESIDASPVHDSEKTMVAVVPEGAALVSNLVGYRIEVAASVDQDSMERSVTSGRTLIRCEEDLVLL
jgi:uncharacterized protein (DUF58 family)